MRSVNFTWEEKLDDQYCMSHEYPVVSYMSHYCANTEAYLVTCQTSKMNSFAKIVSRNTPS